MDSVERDRRAKKGFGERGEVLYNRDSGEIRKKGKLEEKPPLAVYKDEPQISVKAGDPQKENKVTPGASDDQKKGEYNPIDDKSKDADKWQQKK